MTTENRFNRRNPDQTEDFNLDEYINEQAESSGEKFQVEKEGVPLKRKIFAWSVIAVVVFMFFMDPIMRAVGLAESFFASEETSVVELVEPLNTSFDNIPITGTLLEYTGSLKNFTTTDNIGVAGAEALFNAGVSIQYIQALDELDLFDDLSATGILSLYRSDIPLSYFEGMASANLFDEMSGAGLLALYNQDFPISYAQAMGNSGVFDDMSSSKALQLYKADIPEGFYKLLQEQGLEDLSANDVIRLYKGSVRD